jgi:hypothetical protein
MPATGCAGRSGDADIRPAPAPATTDDKPPNHEHHDLRLEFGKGADVTTRFRSMRDDPLPLDA